MGSTDPVIGAPVGSDARKFVVYSGAPTCHGQPIPHHVPRSQPIQVPLRQRWARLLWPSGRLARRAVSFANAWVQRTGFSGERVDPGRRLAVCSYVTLVPSRSSLGGSAHVQPVLLTVFGSDPHRGTGPFSYPLPVKILLWQQL